jgi:hypothetical protein
MFLTLMLLTGSALTGVSPADGGVIEGVVVRAAGQTPVPDAEVVLRAKLRGEVLLAAETVTNAQGKFRFERLPIAPECVYIPGANRGGVHYPGPNVRLTSLCRRAEVKLAVYDAVTFPNPLVVRRHAIALEPRPGVVQVTESMLIDNPTAACYVGQSVGENAEPVTLQLAIPDDFERVTFPNEFFGRRFSLVGGRLVTGIPWPPGGRELRFTYVLPNLQGHYVWRRPLDLPTAQVRVSIHTDSPPQATCNLDPAPRQNRREIVFESRQRTLEAGYLLRVELGHLPVSPMRYAPCGAMAALAGLIVLTSLVMVRSRRSRGTSAVPTARLSTSCSDVRKMT